MGRRSLLSVLLAALLVLPLAFAEPRLTDVHVSPTPAIAGHPLLVEYVLENDAPLGEVVTDIVIPGAIEHQEAENVTEETYRFERRFLLPEGQAGLATLFLLVRAEDAEPITHRVEVPVFLGEDAARAERRVQAPESGVAVLVEPIRNLVQGEAVYFPVTVYNERDEDVEVTLAVRDIDAFATYRIDPDDTLLVPAASMQQAFVYVAVDDDAALGTHTATLVARYDGTGEETQIKVAVLPPERDAQGVPTWAWYVVAALVLLALIVIAVGLYRRRKEGEDEDLVTYF